MNEQGMLYGVPKVAYGQEGCTPYPMCLRSCGQYLGLDVDYARIMAESGAAFRLTWNTAEWDGGNVDAVFAFDDPEKMFACGMRALGRGCRILKRTQETAKGEFLTLIRREIDAGNPVIGLGIIGPPEACVIAGYQGEALLGWNVFQEYPENRAAVSFAENGYFITSAWWENPDTIGLIAMDGDAAPLTLREVLQNAVEVLTGRMDGTHAKGVAAYDAWKAALLSDREFPAGAVLPLLVERMMCHGDAMDCLSDGRHNAAKYLHAMAEQHPAHAEGLNAVAKAFEDVSEILWQEMVPMLGGWERGEKQIRRLAEPEVRRAFAGMIDRMKNCDERAMKRMQEILFAL
ncbi:MAG: RNA polymerase subunit sigma-24 [Clostridia bacterium]|nr:RNA polymerase subunit sigma-24 [Clostridia bacterium]